MFGSFGCRDDFRDCHRDCHCHRNRDCDRDREREREREKEREREREREKHAICNVLRHIAIGTEISLLTIRGDVTFRNVIFEGFSNGVALFSAISTDNKDGNKNQAANTNTFTGILRVCPNDIISIAI
ncbi:hypothetical protein COM62_16845 [Bacillus pseudomycoides]|uniref:DUF3915 family protein n=1 Tax=Bacillus pseudomycoides TaxID=64104 RepID=UPI000BF674C5|nr:DUF3915 family protein [Bacillus pseudomycoides]PGE95827.1 hypothetical protein COM62_16845 [Bacillus pseudomycoides]